MDDLRTTYEESRGAAGRLADQRQARLKVTAELERLRRERALLVRETGPRDESGKKRIKELDERIAGTVKRVDALDREQPALGDALRDALRRFGEFADPVRNASLLDQGTPLLLMPLRMETRFIGSDLLVRAYPDQWAIDTFAPKPTEQEVDNVRRFWALWFRAGGDDGMRRAAWRALVASHGSGRAEWLIEQHKPLHPEDEPDRDPGDVIHVVALNEELTPPERTAAADYWEAVWRSGDPDESARAALVAAIGNVRAELILAAPPSTIAERPDGVNPVTAVVKLAFCIFPVVSAADTEMSSWTSAARANVLPDRLVLLGFRGDAEVLHVTGKPIPPALAVGPDPGAGPSDQFRIVGGDLVVPDELKWMVDFEEAVAVGMGLRVPLNADLREGFDQLLMLGLRTVATPDEDRAALETLLTNHRRSRAGLGIIRQGTPTNNTEDLPSGLDRLDDPDASFDHVFGGVASLESHNEWADKQDGQWLAECLGIDPKVIDGIPGAGLMDQAEARAMNTALWPATLGYFLETMMHPVLDDADVELTRSYFIDHVSGRGRVPALRIGRQPYGVIPIAALAKLRVSPRVDPPADGRMLDVLHRMLMRVMADWAPLAAAVPHVHADDEPHQTLLDVIALHPASVEFHQRYAEAVANLFNGFAFEGVGGQFHAIWEAFASFLVGRQLLADLGYGGSDSPDILGKLFHDTQHRLKGPIIDDRPLSETAQVRAYCDDGRNYLQWLVDAARTSLEVLRKEQGFTGGNEPTALLYILLRHGLLLGWWDTAIRLRLDASTISRDEFKLAHAEPEFVHFGGGGPSESRWSGLYSPAAAIVGDATTPLHEAIPRLLKRRPARHLAETIEAIRRLTGLPTSRLERLLAEHLDCCSHRADAWIGSLATRRLLDMRGVRATDTSTTVVKPRKGIQLGAFGWLEDVRPEPRRLEKVELTKPLEAVFARPQDALLLRDRSNGGYVHAPSLDHGAAAAILRSGFLANATPAHPDTMAINLTSERMRLAVGVLQGMRNGQRLGALLGYQFERGLHDRHGLAEVDLFIHPLRLQFPSAGDRDGRLAIDGLELARHMEASGFKTYPFGRPGMPVPSAPQQEALDLEAGRLLDVHDAIADLVLAEGVYQAVLGNFERVGATLDAVGRGGIPTEPAVLQTPRSGSTLTHRVGLHLRAGLDHLASVAGVAATPRSMADPAVNEYLASMLPSPSDVICRVRWAQSDGTSGEDLVSQAQVGLQPIDLLHVLRLSSTAALGELEQRLALHVQRAHTLGPDAVVTVALTEAVPGSITFFEVAPLVTALRSIVTRSRPLRASDVVPATEASSGTDDVRADRNRPADVLDRMDDLGADIAARAALIEAVADRDERAATVDTHVEATIDLLERAGRFAVPNTGWGDIDQRRAEIFETLHELVTALADRWSVRLASADELLALDDSLPITATDEERIRTLLLAARALTTEVPAPVPTDANAFRATIDAQRAAFVAKLASISAVVAVSTLHEAIDATDALLPLTSFDSEPFAMSRVDDPVEDVFNHLALRLAAAQSEVDRRRTAATQLLAAHDAAPTGAARVEALTGAVRALLGEDALFTPEFHLSGAQGSGWAAAMAWSRTGNLTAHLAASRDFPVDDWLHGVARVREKIHDLEQARLLVTALGRPEPELWPIQLPHRSEPWYGLEWPDTVQLVGARLLYTAHYPSAFDPLASQVGLLLDEWVEVVAGDNTTTGIVFHHDSPDSEPPQAMLLAVPPNPDVPWAWDDIVRAVRDTFWLARLRAVEPDRVADTRYAAFLPATVSEATVRGLGISVNFARNNMLFKHLGV